MCKYERLPSLTMECKCVSREAVRLQNQKAILFAVSLVPRLPPPPPPSYTVHFATVIGGVIPLVDPQGMLQDVGFSELNLFYLQVFTYLERLWHLKSIFPIC
jgi:hypothetical protein